MRIYKYTTIGGRTICMCNIVLYDCYRLIGVFGLLLSLSTSSFYLHNYE